MRRVLKWTVPVDDQWHPVGAGPVIHVASQFGYADLMQIWTVEECSVDGAPYQKPMGCLIVGTGHRVPDFTESIGSMVVADGALVFHAFRSVGQALEDFDKRTS